MKGTIYNVHENAKLQIDSSEAGIGVYNMDNNSSLLSVEIQ